MIGVIDYGAGNLRSITNGLEKVGAKTAIIDAPGGLSEADSIVLPGVGSFGDAMEKLEAFKKPLIDEIGSGKPFLGICLGIQLLFEESQESPGINGLGIFRGATARFKGKLKIPHMGWNTLRVRKDTPLFEGITDGSFFYFVHSYHAVPEDNSIIAAQTEYGSVFPSVIAQDNVFATQFHPEKSSDKGLKILENFNKITRR
jgi:imidazole glycerol-phosphate synthase subunit HisH